MATPASVAPLTMERVRAAQSLLRQVVPESRLAGTDKLSTQGDGWVYLKLEIKAPTGSFKMTHE
jgi:threonine dehydratase